VRDRKEPRLRREALLWDFPGGELLHSVRGERESAAVPPRRGKLYKAAVLADAFLPQPEAEPQVQVHAGLDCEQAKYLLACVLDSLSALLDLRPRATEPGTAQSGCGSARLLATEVARPGFGRGRTCRVSQVRN